MPNTADHHHPHAEDLGVSGARTDTERLDWFEKQPQNLLTRAWDDGTFAFIARASDQTPWPAYGTEPWQDLRTAIDTAMDASDSKTGGA